jgi:hypothetical protein
MADVSKLVRKLTTCFVGGDSDRTDDLYAYTLRILASRLSPSVVDDRYHVVDLIKSKLARQQRSDDEVAVTNHLRKLHSLRSLSKEWSVLYLLYRIGAVSSTTQAFGGVFHADGLQKFAPAVHRPAGHSNQEAPQSIPATIKDATAYRAYHQTVNTASDISDAMLLRDMIFVIQGIDGRYVKYCPRADSFIVDAEVKRSPVCGVLPGCAHKTVDVGWCATCHTVPDPQVERARLAVQPRQGAFPRAAARRRPSAQLAAAPRTYCQILAQRSMLCLGRIVRTSPRDPICARRP